MEEARIKMVGDSSWAKENVISALTRLVAESGLLSTFSGLPAMLSKQAMNDCLNIDFGIDFKFGIVLSRFRIRLGSKFHSI